MKYFDTFIICWKHDIHVFQCEKTFVGNEEENAYV